MKIVEAALFLGCSQTTLRAWADADHLPAYRNPANGYRLFRGAVLNYSLRQVARNDSRPREAR